MIRRIILENFMSHRHTVIEPTDGLTVLVGPNNCGKSAVVVALQTLCSNLGGDRSNLGGDFMVRHGEKECRVFVETGEGNTIEWKRKGKVVSYTLNGREIHRLKGGIPDDLHDLLRLPKVASPDGSEEFDIHFAEQKSPIFLLDKSGKQAALFFASASDAALLMEMQRRHKQKVAEKKRDEQQLVAQAEKLGQYLECLAPIEQIERRVKQAEEDYRIIDRASGQMEQLEDNLRDLLRQTQTLQHAEERSAVLANLWAPPTLADTTPLGNLIESLGKARTELSREEARCQALATLATPPQLRDAQPLEDLCRRLGRQTLQVQAGRERLNALAALSQPPSVETTQPLECLCGSIERQMRGVERLAARADTLTRLTPPPNQQDTQALAELLPQVQKTAIAFETTRARLAVLSRLVSVPVVADPAPLEDVIRKLTEAAAEVVENHRHVERAKADLGKAEQAIRRWAEINPICLTCGAQIDPDRLMAAGGVYENGQG